MTREAERLKAAYEVADITSDNYYARINNFIEGAKWADEHPRKGLVDIEKVCNYLRNILPTCIHYCENGIGKNYRDFITDLKQAMEE